MENCLNQCTHITPGGARCRAAAIKGSDLCFHHNPATAEVRLEARRRGARIRNARRPHPQTAALMQQIKGAAKAGPALLTPLVDAFLKVRDGVMDTRIANSLAYLATIASRMGEIHIPDDGPPKTDVQRKMPRWEALIRRCLNWDNPHIMEVARSLGINEPIPPDDPRMHTLVQRLCDLDNARRRGIPAPPLPSPQGPTPQGGGGPKTPNVPTPSDPASSANTPGGK